MGRSSRESRPFPSTVALADLGFVHREAFRFRGDWEGASAEGEGRAHTVLPISSARQYAAEFATAPISHAPTP